MNSLRSPYPESEEESEGEDDPLMNDGDEDDEQEEEWEKTSVPTHPDNKALIDFVDIVVPSGELDWTKDADAIFARYPALERTSELTRKTVLHLLIEAWVKNIGSNRGYLPIKKAFVAIFNRYPKLTKVRDGVPGDVSGQTVLYSAIADGGSNRIVDILFKDRGKKADPNDPISQAISVMCCIRGREENALHLALRSKPEIISPTILKRIVKRATESAVAAVDKAGFTPLHYATDYARCSKEQYSIVKTLLKTGETRSLIKKGKAVLDFVTHAEKLSVYQYHVKTRETYREKAPGFKSGQQQSSKREEDLTALKRKQEQERLEDRKREIKRRQEREQRNKERAERDQTDDEAERDKSGPPRRAVTRPEKGGSAPTHPRDDPRNEPRAQTSVPAKGPPNPPRDDPRGPKEGPGKEGPKEGPGRGRDARPDQRVAPSARDDSQRPRDLRDIDIRSPLKTVAANSPKDTRSNKDPEEEETLEDRKAKRDQYSDKMKMEIKLQYLRTRAHHQSVEFLYGKNQNDIQISFEYSGLALEADALSFRQSFRDVVFDDVLKYVAFPAVHVKDWRDRPEDYGALEKAPGRFDMLFFFHWLREEKKVKRILKVIVEDCEQPPHSDQAIELCLDGFGVETLDWSKPDLDPDTVCKASSDLGELVLHWNGNNAVLRAWSDPEIRQQLSNLSMINLIVDSTLETSDRTKKYIDDFDKRLKTPYAALVPVKAAAEDAAPAPVDAGVEKKAAKDRAMMPPPPVPNTGIRRTTTEVFVNLSSKADADEDGSSEKGPENSKPTVANPATPAASSELNAVKPMKPVQVKAGEGLLRRNNGGPGIAPGAEGANLSTPPHRWLDATDAFAEQVANVWKKIVDERKRVAKAAIDTVIASRGTITPSDQAEVEATKGPPADIIVAVIDDGVDTTVEQLSQRVLAGRTFSYDEERDRVRPWYVSENNHGTIMASMIVRVCPMAKIYPIRLSTGRGGTIDPMSAAKAIEAALDRGADIISMSWTVSPPPAQSPLKAAFDAALQRAIDSNVLMFCSAKDSGHVSDQYYPAGYRPDSVVKVGAANPTGLAYDWAGSLDRLDFIFPGVEVVQQHGAGAPAGISKLTAETGSSVATALGAGLAALIMCCARIALVTGTVGLTSADVERLRKRDVMVETIARFGRSTSDKADGKFIEVWNKLNTRTKAISRDGAKNGRLSVAQLARDLINISA
ncbi:hypothetical protein B0T16DRAFT_451309 [Cercophora newfieldiana]|uniref:Peptidase S8/S53 domain-containing protein n=1 Tax=Cercophora newfieldiana TaxID=92897 RepID=A0AA39YN76_9PEZI|nr:hypothetical protein B0T16DRAFT_451309 [Cercophora newfieldiana]